MATLYIKEYQKMKHDDKGFLIGPGVLVAQQKVTISGTTAQSSALDAKTQFVVLEADVPCQYTYGSNPTATATSLYLSANNRILEASFAQSDKFAVITQQ